MGATGVVGFEPTTSRLTVDDSTAELYAIVAGGISMCGPNHLCHHPAVTGERVALPANVGGGGHPPGLPKQDLDRCYARTFPDHAERCDVPVWIFTTQDYVNQQSHPEMMPPAFRIISSGAKWQRPIRDLNP